MIEVYEDKYSQSLVLAVAFTLTEMTFSLADFSSISLFSLLLLTSLHRKCGITFKCSILNSSTVQFGSELAASIAQRALY